MSSPGKNPLAILMNEAPQRFEGADAKSSGSNEALRSIVRAIFDEILKRNEKEGRAKYTEAQVDKLAPVLNQFLNHAEYEKDPKAAKLFREFAVLELSSRSDDSFEHDIFNDVAALGKIVQEILKRSSLQKLLSKKTENSELSDKKLEGVVPKKQFYNFLFVKTLTGKTITLIVEPSDTIEAVKEKVLEKEDIPIGSQKIIFLGKQRGNREVLEDCGIKNESTVYLHLGLSGD